MKSQVEAFLQWRFFMDWNETGVRGRLCEPARKLLLRFIFVLAILATVVKPETYLILFEAL